MFVPKFGGDVMSNANPLRRFLTGAVEGAVVFHSEVAALLLDGHVTAMTQVAGGTRDDVAQSVDQLQHQSSLPTLVLCQLRYRTKVELEAIWVDPLTKSLQRRACPSPLPFGDTSYTSLHSPPCQISLSLSLCVFLIDVCEVQNSGTPVDGSLIQLRIYRSDDAATIR